MKKSFLHDLNWKKLLGWILFVSLLASIVFSIYNICTTPETLIAAEGERLRSDYILMLTECVLGLIVMSIPSVLDRRPNIDIPDVMYILYFVFLYCAIILGEVRNFYFVFPHWDTFLHCLSAMMLAIFGFTLVVALNDSPKISLHLSPRFVCLFTFCFAVATGALWEIYEFSFDGLLGMNMQKFRLEDGTLLVGREALIDTMDDLITDVIGALIISATGFITQKKKEAKAREAAKKLKSAHTNNKK